MQPISSGEYKFLQDYAGIARQLNLDLDPYNPEHQYDYKAAMKTGNLPELFRIKERSPFSSEAAYFNQNPHVAGMAAEDNQVILNPYSKLNNSERSAVLLNERARVYMNKNNIDPNFSLTEEQKNKFKSYGLQNQIKQTIAARILSGDPSVTPSDEQQEWVETNLGPTTHWPSTYKQDNHERKYLSTEAGYIDTRSGKPYVPNEISTITGQPLASPQQEFDARTRLLSSLAESYELLYGRPESEIDAGVVSPFKREILKSLSKSYRELRNVPTKDWFSRPFPDVTREHYHGIHAIPDKALKRVDKIAFTNELGLEDLGETSWWITNKEGITKPSRKAEVKLNPSSVQIQHDVSTAPPHEISHAMQATGSGISPAITTKEDFLRTIEIKSKLQNVPFSYETDPLEVASLHTGIQARRISNSNFKRTKTRLIDEKMFEEIYNEGLDRGIKSALKYRPEIAKDVYQQLIDELRFKYPPAVQRKIKSEFKNLMK